MNVSQSGVLLAGFGGPGSPREVKPFLERIFSHANIPPARFKEMVRRYRLVGGSSPYDSVARRQKKALQNWFAKKNHKVQIETGFLYSKPFIFDALKKLTQRRAKNIYVLVLTAFRSGPSFGRYQIRIDEALNLIHPKPKVIYTEPFFAKDEFIEAMADRIRKTEKANLPTHFIFSAHSIPVRLAEKSHYAAEFLTASKRIAKKLKLKNWSLAYQSRSGLPHDPWLGPDVQEVIQKIDPSKVKQVCLVPVGFLLENMELLYDLDVEARKICRRHGLGYRRVKALNDDPKWIETAGSILWKALK